MTRDDAKVLWPIIKAWSEGKTLQFLAHSGGRWCVVDEYDAGFSPDRYRIKPEPIECYGVVDADGALRIFKDRNGAIFVAAGYQGSRAIKLREVTE
jgi:hypothetical protein